MKTIFNFIFLAAGASPSVRPNSSWVEPRFQVLLRPGDDMSPSSPDNVPALAPPAGITPNFVNPYSLSPAFVAAAIVCLLFATAALIIRLATSLLGSNKRLHIEDCMIFEIPQMLLMRVLTEQLHVLHPGFVDRCLSESIRLIGPIGGPHSDRYINLP